MTWTRENMFEPSGCLTREAFEALLTHQLPADALALADEHLASCPFCSDALEGFRIDAPETGFAATMDKADEGFATLTSNIAGMTTKKKVLWIAVPAAASILLLVELFLLTNQPRTNMQVAQKIPRNAVEKPTGKPAEPAEIAKNKLAKGAEPKAPPAKQVKTSIRFTPPEVISEENKALVMEEETNMKKADNGAPQAASAVVADNLTVTDQPKNEDYNEIPAEDAFSSPGSDKRAAKVSMVKTVSSEAEPVPLQMVEKMPEYPGGQDAMMKFIRENLRYPATASEMGISGKVILQFVVEKDGKISGMKVLRGIGGGCDEEAIRVVKLMPDWKPATQDGKPVPVYFILPISFNLHK